jgi:hypothetical protein
MSNNVVAFPATLWDGRRWWHAGKSYVHLGKLKAIAAPKDWCRAVQWSLKQRLRKQLQQARGNNAA